jgi:hypothetical protein
MSKVIAALGGEANLRKHQTLEITYEINLTNHGVLGTGTIAAKAPNFKSNKMTLTALGKTLGTVREYFDGTTGGRESSIMPENMSPGELAQERVLSDFYAPLKWSELYKTIEITGITKAGDEEAYIVVKVPQASSPITDYISTKSFLLLQRETASGLTKYWNYREVAGVMVPFKRTIDSSHLGEQIISVKTVKFGVPISDEVFTKNPKSN